MLDFVEFQWLDGWHGPAEFESASGWRRELGSKSKFGKYFVGDAKLALCSDNFRHIAGTVQLVLTSPPFPLNHKKKYGNRTGDDYVAWLASFAPIFSELLTDDGSIVIELGNGWLPGRPVQSLLTLEALMAFVKHETADLRLCQEFVSYNPSRMPSPAQWVTVQRCRVTDSFTHIWWMARSDFPKADNRRVLRPYSASMKKLLETRRFNRGDRPSGFKVSDQAFRNDNGGAIAHSLFELEDIDPTGRRDSPMHSVSPILRQRITLRARATSIISSRIRHACPLALPTFSSSF
jgi:hypothetical protein